MEEVKFEMESTVSDTADEQMTSIATPSQQQMSPTNTNTTTTSINKTSSEVRLTDEEFMEVIRDFPGVYDKNHEDFRDKTKKEECWEKISDVLNVRIEDTKRRYETIRTRLSRHLKRIKEGYWSIDSKDMKLDFLNWLVPYIKTRDAPFQFKQHENGGGGGSSMKRDYSMSFDDEHEGGDPTHHYVNHHRHHHQQQHHRDEEHDDVTRVSMITIGAGSSEGGGSKTDSSNSNHEDESNNSNLPVVASITSVTPSEYTVMERHSPNVIHRNNKRKMVENAPGPSNTNNGNYPMLQIQQPSSTSANGTNQKHYFFEKHQHQQQRRMSSTSPPSSSHPHHHQHPQTQTQTAILHSNLVPVVNGAIVGKNGRDPKQQQQKQQQHQEQFLDEDEHYCMSLVGRMRKLDSKKKAYLRSTVEKLFLDFELGYVQFPKQPSYPAPPSQ